MDIKKKVEVFFKALENKDKGVITTLFASDAHVFSREEGKVPALTFFDQFFMHTDHSGVEILGYFHGEEPGKIIAHFRIIISRKDGLEIPEEGLDLFSFDTYGRIEELKMLSTAWR